MLRAGVPSNGYVVTPLRFVLPGALDRVGCYEHAVALGAGAEALLGRVEGALVQGHGGSGAAYAAARRSETTALDCVQDR